MRRRSALCLPRGFSSPYVRPTFGIFCWGRHLNHGHPPVLLSKSCFPWWHIIDINASTIRRLITSILDECLCNNNETGGVGERRQLDGCNSFLMASLLLNNTRRVRRLLHWWSPSPVSPFLPYLYIASQKWVRGTNQALIKLSCPRNWYQSVGTGFSFLINSSFPCHWSVQ